jgi:Rrf2 family transcriptional regulator, cysteine metabolism repressor
MKLTTQSEYALLALTHLARCDQDTFISVREIAAAQEIPPKFLEQILLRMKRAKVLHSLKGPSGGYRLCKPASKIMLAEIVREFDGPLAPVDSASKYFYESSPIEKEKKVLSFFREIRNYIAAKMESTSIADVC